MMPRAVLLTLAATGACLFLQLRPPLQRTSVQPVGEQAASGRWMDLDGAALSDPLGPNRRRLGSRPSPRALDGSIESLERIVFESPGSAAARSNLAFLLVERAHLQARPVDLLEALEHLQWALKAAPDRPEVLFNYALALTRLSLTTSAQLAWDRYLEVEPEPRWSDVAQDQLQELRRPTLFERWESEGKARLRHAAEEGDLASATGIVETYPTFARLWIEEELLPEWAEAALRGEAAEAARQTVMLRVLGRALAAATHDGTVQDTLDRADETSRETRRLLLQGLRLYGRGMVAYRAFGPEEEKTALLRKAAQDLRSAGSPLAGWALLYHAVCLHRSDPRTATGELSWLASVTLADRQPALLARIEWMLGTTEETQNRYERALEHFRRARAHLLASEGPRAAAFVELLIAEALSKLGEVEEAWAVRIGALDDLASLGDYQRLHAALYSSVEQLVVEKRFAAAQPWVQELEANAVRWQTALGSAEAALQKGHLLAESNHTAAARESFRRARQSAGEIGESWLRRRTTATVDLYAAEGLLREAPETAQQDLARARPEMIALGYRFQLPRLDSARALASLAAGDREAAIHALRSSIAEEEAIRREVRDEVMRASAFDGAQRAFDTLLELELTSPGGDARAFGYAEQSRARVLLDLLTASDPLRLGVEHLVSLERVTRELDRGTDLIEFAALPDRLVVWQVRQGQSRRFETRISAEDLERQVTRLRRAIEVEADEPTVRTASAALWSLLLGPIAERLPAGQSLVVVPDRFLGRVPFAALFDPERERYLVEDHQITIAPSASAYLAARARRGAMGATPPSSVLAVGANHPDQPWLPRVESEAAAVSSLYPLNRLLVADAATRTAFLDAGRRAEVVHFAGHGRDDARAPHRARLYFRPSGPEDSGLLLGQEIAAARFTETRLAVIAACRSLSSGARGRETISGLAGAFLAAGVPTVAANLWNIDDRATETLVTAFHDRLRHGLTPSAALRQAQLEMLFSDSPFASPRYWAGFVTVGAE